MAEDRKREVNVKYYINIDIKQIIYVIYDILYYIILCW